MMATRKRAATGTPWWMQVLDRHGIAVVFSIILLGGMMKVSDYHLKFLDEQTNQMKLQTRTLELIEQSTRANSESNRRQESLMEEIGERLEDGVDRSVKAHEEILNGLNKNP